MNDTELGTCQVIFARCEHDVEVDLVLSGEARVEGYSIVPRSPLTVAFAAPTEPWARRRMLRVLRGWADEAAECHAGITFGDEMALLTIRSGADSLAGAVTDLDALFASDLPSQHQD